ncbi:hypothetical protein NHX12_026796 [Muraenolepis orangiensis]|uniref:Prepronociceptin n=1 Tax=Muraenolepis orangiensis TaxID=630683 RepID=A0A9Q0IR74_9TELE|nr:hypothetical protein NHX12_026796 [Muraenolepis orangiensis]
MRSAAWSLAVLGALAALLSPGRSDCLEDCRACGPLEHPDPMEHTLNTMVCYLECSGHLTTFLWEMCKQAGGRQLQYPPEDVDTSQTEEVLQEGEEPRYPSDQEPFPPNAVQYDSLLLGSAEEEEEDEERMEGAELSLEGGVRTPRDVSIDKRFGGFLRGRQGYMKLVGAAPRLLQKRYGGFIGVRKSARKWNSQKRVNQLLRQYLGLRNGRGGGRGGGRALAARHRRSDPNL